VAQAIAITLRQYGFLRTPIPPSLTSTSIA
jgi:hypothetical protein